MTEKPEDKIVRLMRDNSTGRLMAEPQGNISVSGRGNVVAGRDVHIHNTTSKPTRPKVIVQTGEGTIDAKQKADLTAKLKQFLMARNLIRVDKMSIAAGWSAINSHVAVNSYHEMTPDQYKMALAWIANQRRILNGMKSAPAKLPTFRADAIKAIKARSKQLGDLNFYRPHITVKFGISTLTGLSDRQLQELRDWIMQQKKGSR